VGVDDTRSRVTPPPERVLPQGAAIRLDDGALRLSLALPIYPTDAILRTCYWLTERAYFYLEPRGGDAIEVTLISKADISADTNELAWEFLESLVDQCLRLQINAETRAVRELIVAQAFAEVDLIDDRGPITQRAESDVETVDRRGIQNWRPVS
jgi:His-Xaa-Ser system protein HxsD